MIRFDPNKTAIFNPCNLNLLDKPRKAVMIFDDEVWEDYVLPNKEISSFEVKNARGRVFDDYRIIEKDGENILIIYPNMGGSASAADLELLIASGIKKVVAFGTCGAMDKKIAKNTIIVPTAAFREEGVSYHYLPPSDEVVQPENSQKIIKEILTKNKITFVEGKVWTTDAVYRETPAKLKRLKEEGCIAVDMELASLLAVAEFRGTKFAQFLIADDNIDGGEEDEKPRSSEQILGLAFDVLSLM
jgi:uridine phosphorylase